ncbi:hypothetical protein [Solwaraspora sp. WMMD792]|uniref:hypothetical protein n=1 Tax=Solwaraspora sp. WMMD792 TaxID=3016099 RepID=UPI002417FE1A|nr:hypothetical protein [Solwaraspora sp. WMMD792]MDG4771529.1 hypothetical protein [Solwaraspora sp. WMMD792]
MGYLVGGAAGHIFLIFHIKIMDWPLLPGVLVTIGFVLGGFLIGTFMGMEPGEDHTGWGSSSAASTSVSWSSLPPTQPQPETFDLPERETFDLSQHVDDVPSPPPALPLPAPSPSSTSADSGGYDGGSDD